MTTPPTDAVEAVRAVLRERVGMWSDSIVLALVAAVLDNMPRGAMTVAMRAARREGLLTDDAQLHRAIRAARKEILGHD